MGHIVSGGLQKMQVQQAEKFIACIVKGEQRLVSIKAIVFLVLNLWLNVIGVL